MNPEKIEKLKKFTTDPDWRIVQELFDDYMKELRDVSTIETQGATADQVFAEVKGREMTIRNLEKFLSQMNLYQKKNTEPISYK